MLVMQFRATNLAVHCPRAPSYSLHFTTASLAGPALIANYLDSNSPALGNMRLILDSIDRFDIGVNMDFACALEPSPGYEFNYPSFTSFNSW